MLDSWGPRDEHFAIGHQSSSVMNALTVFSTIPSIEQVGRECFPILSPFSTEPC